MVPANDDNRADDELMTLKWVQELLEELWVTKGEPHIIIFANKLTSMTSPISKTGSRADCVQGGRGQGSQNPDQEQKMCL